MSGSHPLDDDELMAVLADSLADTDPVPDHVLEAAKAVPEIAGLDAELALLTFDSEQELAGVRGVGTGRQLSFEAGDVEVEVVVHTEEHQGRRVPVLEGQVIPAGPVKLTLASNDPFVPVQTETADELGRFRFRDLPAGAVRVVVQTSGGPVRARPVVTSWFLP